MIYPDNFERKIGFSEIRTLLKGKCMSSLGTEWIDNNVAFQTDYAKIRESLQQAADFDRFEQTEDEVYEPNFFDVRQPLLRIRPERTFLEETELFDLKRSLETAIALVTFFCQDDEDSEAEEADEEEDTVDGEGGKSNDDDSHPYPSLTRMSRDVAIFPQVVKRIDEILNKYGKIKDTASPQLLTIRRSIEMTTRGLSHTLRSIITDAQSQGYIERDVTPTMRDGRLVIPVSPSLKRKIKGIVHDESATGKTVFIEPAAIVDANNKIRELKSEEKREITRILQELTAQIRPYVKDILRSLQYLGHVDYLRALSAFALSFDAVVPDVRPYPLIHWFGAVHPLLQISLKKHGRSMNALDIDLPEKKRIAIISGPNAGGKSVCLKTVGLLQYMMQCGMPVPLKETSEMGVFDGIFIDIGDEQSLEDDLSTYSSHLLNMKNMMKYATRNSLLLIDEFGSGTEPQIGGALAEAILCRFVEAGTFGVITTHYQNLKHFAQTSPTVVNAAMLYDRAQMRPLFALQIGNPGSSFAIDIARKIGIPEDVVKQASDMVGQDYVMSDKYLQDIVRDKRYWENKRKDIHNREKRLEQMTAEYADSMEKFKQERREIIEKSKEEARQLLQDSNAKIENTIRAIKEAQAEKERTKEIRQELEDFKEQAANRTADDARIDRALAKLRRRQERKKNGVTGKANSQSPLQQSGNQKSQKTSSQPQDLTAALVPGTYVRIKGQNTIGQIESVKGNSAKVLFGMIHTNVDLKRLQATAPPKEDNFSKVSTFVSKETRDAMYEKKLHFKPEIDLRGMRADEALSAVSYFIDDAIQLEQSRVRILHGTGTGALRELVRNYLATVPGVKNYHDEHVQFGGAGITVAELE